MWGIIILAILIIFFFGVAAVFMGREVFVESKTITSKLLGIVVILVGALIIYIDGAAVNLLFSSLK